MRKDTIKRSRYVNPNGVKCLVCEQKFTRVGSHAVQAHGYESSAEYRRSFGLNKNETRTDAYANKMRRLIADSSIKNLENGKPNRFVKGDNKCILEYWKNRKSKKGFIKVGHTIGNKTRLEKI